MQEQWNTWTVAWRKGSVERCRHVRVTGNPAGPPPRSVIWGVPDGIATLQLALAVFCQAGGTDGGYGCRIAELQARAGGTTVWLRPRLQLPPPARNPSVPGHMHAPACRRVARLTIFCVAALHFSSQGVQCQGSAAVAASGNARATATQNGETISVTGAPGCGATATAGSNAYAYASGTPIANIVVKWGLNQTYVPLDLCNGSSITFEWNTGDSSQVYGLYQLNSTACPGSFEGEKLIITPASSPSTTNQVTINLSLPGPVSWHAAFNIGTLSEASALLCLLQQANIVLPIDDIPAVIGIKAWQ